MEDIGVALFYLGSVCSLTAWGVATQRLVEGRPVFDPVLEPRPPVPVFVFAAVCWLLVSMFALPWLLPPSAPVPIEPDVTEPAETDSPETETEVARVEPVETESRLSRLVNGLLAEFVIFAFLVLIWWMTREPLPQPTAVEGEEQPAPPPAAPRQLEFKKEIEQGGLAFLLFLPCVYVVNYLVRELSGDDSLHPLLETVRQDPSLTLLLLVAVNALIMAPLLEELQFRVILQGWLSQHIRPWLAVALPALIFCGVHRFPDAIALVPLALILGWLYHSRGSYLAVVTAHALFNAFNLAMQLNLTE